MKRFLFIILLLFLISCKSLITTNKEVSLIKINSLIYTDDDSIKEAQVKLSDFKSISPIDAEHCSSFIFYNNIENYKKGIIIPKNLYKREVLYEKSKVFVYIIYDAPFSFSYGGDNVLSLSIPENKKIIISNTFYKEKKYFQISDKGELLILNKNLIKINKNQFEILHKLRRKSDNKIIIFKEIITITKFPFKAKIIKMKKNKIICD